ncbi:MAG: hypothetical protein ACREJ3_00915 [Polyangiaceae bacterium]
MSLSRDAVLELMGLVDGELDADESARAEALHAGSEEARQLVASMRASPVGVWLRETHGERASAASAGIAGAVMAKVSTISQGEAGVARISMMRAKRSSWGRMVFAGAGGALALAAGLAIFARARRVNGPEPVVATLAQTPRAAVTEPPIAVAQGTAQAPVAGVEVDDIDAPSRGVSVFEIPLGGAAAAMVGAPHASSVVIWVDDDTAQK